MHIFAMESPPMASHSTFQVREGLRDVSAEAKCVGVAQQPSGFTFVDLQIERTQKDKRRMNTVDRRNLAPLTTGSLSHPLQMFVHPKWSADFFHQHLSLGIDGTSPNGWINMD